uniref:Uncharacterized protein n=1 Tax=Timema cristinae TaxID=61476 RepID=A0A7R9H4P6_TIMCR|nr:unnamed protein product [Timema cristinae]
MRGKEEEMRLKEADSPLDVPASQLNINVVHVSGELDRVIHHPIDTAEVVSPTSRTPCSFVLLTGGVPWLILFVVEPL